MTDFQSPQWLIELKNITVKLGGRDVLNSISFNLAEGEFVGLIGTNGAGKTTLLRTILGLITPNSGQLSIAQSTSQKRSSIFGYVPQKLSVDPNIPVRVFDFVFLGVDGHRLGLPKRSRESRNRVEEVLALLDIDGLATQRLGTLSGGELQRATIAHALVSRPKILILDEPLANLDIKSESEIVGVLSNISKKLGVGILISAHEMNTLLPFMDKVIYLANGRVASGRTKEVITHEVLSGLYGYPINVFDLNGRIVVMADQPGEIDHLGSQ